MVSLTRLESVRPIAASDRHDSACDSPLVIHGEHTDRRSSCRRPADDPGAIGFEVIDPDIPAGMEKGDQGAVGRVDPCKIRPLVEVAPVARQREILGGVRPAVLLRDDVLDLEGEALRILKEETILAPSAGPSPNGLARCDIDHELPFRPFASRRSLALSFSVAMMSSTLM